MKSDIYMVLIILWIFAGSICAMFEVSFKEYGIHYMTVTVILFILNLIAVIKERKKDI